MEMEIEYGLEELPQVACRLIEYIGGRKVVAFHAGMGAGKTTLIAEMARRMGVTEDVANSPSFAIINEYEGTDRRIYHFDCYRIETLEDAVEIGVEDYLYSGALCLIEWPDVISGLLPEDTLHLSIEEDMSTGKRKLTNVEK